MSVLGELQRTSLGLTYRFWQKICIMHPGCSQPLLSLPAFAYPSTEAGTHTQHCGFDHRLALDACHILTNHAGQGQSCYLSKDRAGQDPIPRHSDLDVLAPGQYFYHPQPYSAPTYNANYRIVTDFAAWRFPEKIPDHWIRPKPSPAERWDLRLQYISWRPLDMWSQVTSADAGCVVTKFLNCYNVFHVVPQDQADWFMRNNLDQYSWNNQPTVDSIHDPANGLTLRIDLGDCFDWHGLVFVPAGEGKFMTYILGPYPDYALLFHRRLVTIPRRVPDEFLYARFAHFIINLVDEGSLPRLNRFPLPKGVKP